MKKTLRWVSLILVCLSFLTMTAFAQETIVPLSSSYIKGSSAGITYKNTGDLEIYFWVSGKSVMSEIGATSIELYEVNGDSSSLIKTYRYTDYGYSHLMGANKGVHTASVTYSGTKGQQYYAKVYLTVGNSSGSDSIIEIAQ